MCALVLETENSTWRDNDLYCERIDGKQWKLELAEDVVVGYWSLSCGVRLPSIGSEVLLTREKSSWRGGWQALAHERVNADWTSGRFKWVGHLGSLEEPQRDVMDLKVVRALADHEP